MRVPLVTAFAVLAFHAPASARGRSAHSISSAGQPPEVVAHEPDPHALMTPFKVFLVDDHSCPQGEIKRYTRGSTRYQVAPIRECISR